MNQIHCPNCGTVIDVNDILSHQLEEEIQKKYQAQLNQTRDEFLKKQEQLVREKEEFEEKKRRENELFQERFETKLKEERKLLEDRLKQKLATEQAEQFDVLQKELNEKSEQIKELSRTKAEIERLKREKEELKEAVQAEAMRQLNQQLQEEKEKIRRSEEERNELRVKELLKQLEDQKKLTEEMKRKQEQGSMQLQGEVQELAIEEWLASQFPLDTIEEIKKGARGGDCIQIVHTRSRQNCGTIYYESKRTKDFQPSWIEKFKADIREKSADIGVLVTEVMPSDMERMGMRDGVWVCTFEEFKGLSAVLRESVIQWSNVVASQENKGDKMSLLYDFLTSSTFRMQVEAIVEAFSQMKADLESEKRSMMRNAVQDVKALELPGENLDEDQLLD